MTRGEIQGKYHQERIRCLNVQDFLKILDIFNSSLKEDDWYANEEYTYYSPKLDTVVYSDKGDEILASDVINEFENTWLIEDGQTISQKLKTPVAEDETFLEKWSKVAPSLAGDGFDVFKTGFKDKPFEKSLKQAFPNPNNDETLGSVKSDNEKKIEEFIKDSFEKTKENHTLEKLGDNQKVTKEELEQELKKALKKDSKTIDENSSTEEIIDEIRNLVEEGSKKAQEKDYLYDSIESIASYDARVAKEFLSLLDENGNIKPVNNDMIFEEPSKEFVAPLTNFEKIKRKNQKLLFEHREEHGFISDEFLQSIKYYSFTPELNNFLNNRDTVNLPNVIKRYNYELYSEDALKEWEERVNQINLSDILDDIQIVKNENVELLNSLKNGVEYVHHPNHYGGENNVYEAIKIIEAHDLNFVEGNVVKYLLRYKKKNGFEDLEKALWYMNRLVENYKKNN